MPRILTPESDSLSSVPMEPGIGLDIGTMNFVAARQTGEKVVIKRVRDVFIDLPLENRRMLRLSNTAFAELDGRLLVIGDDALQTANLLNREVRRPLQGGMISAGELDAQQVIGLIMKQILGPPQSEGEQCCHSVPAVAIDVPGSDVTYHTAVLGKILHELGYKPKAMNEALAVVYSECPADFCGLGISYGSGMTNVCLAYNTMSALEFALGRGGDWIDAGAARSVGGTSAKMCAVKEGNASQSGIDLMQLKNRDEEALAFFVQALIDYTLDAIIKEFVRVKRDVLIPKPIPIIISGGTSLAGGFLDKFRERFDMQRKRFPIEISEIRQATDPMTAVATGLLVYARADD
jgi:hypothetical protein